MSDFEVVRHQVTKRSKNLTNQLSGVHEMENEKLETAKKSDQHRVVISAPANDALERFRSRVVGSSGDVDVTKSELANYVFENIERLLSEQDMRKLRSMYFDESKFLEALSKKSADGQELPAHIRKAIREHLAEREEPKKKAVIHEKSDM